MLTRTKRIAIALIAASCALTGSARAESDQAESRKLVVEAGKTYKRFMQDPNLDWFHKNKDKALAFLISPKIVKAGFVIGGSGGRAVLVAKGDKGWTGPAFYTLGTASVGFQAGVSNSEAVILVMTQKGLDSLMSSSMKMGGDVSITVGPTGASSGATVTGDLVVYTRSKGLYGGVNVDGAVVKPSDDLNAAYYGQAASPIDIVVKDSVKHNKADDAPLLNVVGRPTKTAK